MRHITFRLTDYDYWNYPDSKEYVYREKKADKRPVWIMEADGSHPRVVEALHYHCALDGSRPVWKPVRNTR
jgi:TolB protein